MTLNPFTAESVEADLISPDGSLVRITFESSSHEWFNYTAYTFTEYDLTGAWILIVTAVDDSGHTLQMIP